jgi:PIN domain nuclease of toxin-antitoxin system
MKYYLDTNIIIFYLFSKDETDDLLHEVLNLFADYYNLFYTCSVCISELLHLYKSGNIIFKKSKLKNVGEILGAIHEANIEIIPISERHLITYANLDIPYYEHNDPNDHLIIAQSISDKIPIISSDKKFKLYEKQGLQFIFKKR